MLKKIKNTLALILIGCVLFSFSGIAQPHNVVVAPTLAYKISKSQISYPLQLLGTVNNDSAFLKWIAANKLVCKNTVAKHSFLITVKDSMAFALLLQNAPLVFINEYHLQASEELLVSSLDLSANSINMVHGKMPLLNGNGLVLSLKENLLDTADIDIAGRYLYNPLASAAYSPHAAIMATMAAGAGNSGYLGTGAAPAASITASDYSNLLPDANTNYQQFGISVQNHSYGVGVENFYGADAAAFDVSATQNNKLLFVFSSGNSGTAAATTGTYAGINGMANLTGSFKMAKNIITVGAADSFGVVPAASSKGPAYDGRLKPELVAFGQDGSSGAAALVSGTAVLLQQAYKNSHAGNLPSASLVKAILLNSADDVASEGIDFTSGYGNLNAYKAVQGVLNGNYFSGAVSHNALQSFVLTVPPNTSKLKCTLVWNDSAAAVNAGKALVNDLDLELQSTTGSDIWQPWVLSSFPNKDSLQLLPIRKRDSLNVVEQITLNNPAAGNYIIQVKGFAVHSQVQSFAIACQLDTAGIFTWQFPSAADNAAAGASNTLRWSSSLTTTTGSIQYSTNNGTSWQLIDAAADLSKKYLHWTAPDTNTTAILKITAGTQSFISDVFTISSRPLLKVGFNCTDSVLLYWNKNKGVSQYQLYALGATSLQPVAVISDTQFVFSTQQLPFKNFAVASKMATMNGVKSTTINYNTQGLDCYINTITADLVNNTGEIQLLLGTKYQVKKISFEKWVSGSFITIRETGNITGLFFSATDQTLIKGNNIYRVKLELLNGKNIYSNTVSVFYFSTAAAIVYPNPVLQYHTFTIQLNTFQASTIQIFSSTGEKVYEKKLSQFSGSISANFNKGIYIIKIILTESGNISTSKLVVL